MSQPTSLKFLKEILNRLASGHTMSEEQTEEVFEIILNNEATPSQIGALLMALRLRGETVDELTSAARIMQRQALPIEMPEGTFSICSTADNSVATHNISTTVALLTAACGIPVTHHNIHLPSFLSESSNILSELGVKIDCGLNITKESLSAANFGFIADSHYTEIINETKEQRQELGIRNIFDLLIPLINPTRPQRQIIGVFAQHWIEPIAIVLGKLGLEKAWVVHGSDGLDGITLSSPTMVAEFNHGEIRKFTVTPEEAGLTRNSTITLLGDDTVTNGQALLAMFKGEIGVYRDIVLLNTAASLVVCNKVTDLKEGVTMAAHALDSGKALNVLEQVISITNRLAAP